MAENLPAITMNADRFRELCFRQALMCGEAWFCYVSIDIAAHGRVSGNVCIYATTPAARAMAKPSSWER